MLNGAQLSLAGYVASAPTLRQLPSGAPAATLRVAYTPRWMSRETGEWVDGPTSFLTVQCYRALAVNVATSLRKGEPVLVTGRLRVRRYEIKGEPRTAVEVDAKSIGHDLSRGVATFSRTRRPPGETAGVAGAAMSAPGEAGESGSDTDLSVPAGLDEGAAEATGGPMLDEQVVAELTREMGEPLEEVTAPF